MFYYNKRYNLIERNEFSYPLQDVKEPNLYKNLYSYDEVPKIAFNRRIVPMEVPDEIWITDTTFRDGQQAREPYTVEQIVTIYKMLNKLGGPNGKIKQSEFFIYSKKDQEAVYKCLELGYKAPEVTTWIRATKEDFELAKSIGIRETGILVSCSDYHIFQKMKSTRSKIIDKYIKVISDCIEMGIYPRCHFEDITRADFYGFVVPFAERLSDLSKQSGIPIKIRACDTMGYGVSIPGTVIPRSVAGLIYGLRHHAQIPSECLEWHGHNDFYRAVANATTAWLYGCSSVNTSLFGIGERTGNTPLEAMVMEYAQLRGTLDGMDTTVITDIAEYFEKEIGYEIPPMTPFVGKNFNVTKAGIHADGILKNEEIYNIFNTEKLLKRPVKVAVSKTSGLAGIAYWLNSNYKDKEFGKRDKITRAIKAWVDRQFENGRVTAIGDKELKKIADRIIIDKDRKFAEKLLLGEEDNEN
ncbi:MAG: 2-isopropylmalate synthase [Clostridiales bacterium]|nr:2-isopropylmalate synthase [Clostridiales bacterium]